MAIPQYQDYVIRTQVTRAYGELNTVRTGVEVCLNEGRTGLGNSAAVNNCFLGYTCSTIVLGATRQDDGTACPPNMGVPQIDALRSNTILTTTFGNAAHTMLTGTTLNMARQSSGSYVCGSTGIQAKHLPKGCT
ncbi:MAG: pilin [Betaproteobacteria bacterium]|nr:pilin [Betaproteobacteria bacterium]